MNHISIKKNPTSIITKQIHDNKSENHGQRPRSYDTFENGGRFAKIARAVNAPLTFPMPASKKKEKPHKTSGSIA